MEGLIFGILRYLNCKLYISLNRYIAVVVVVVVVVVVEFRQSSIMWFLTRRAINGMDTKNKKGRTDTVAFDLSKVKQLRSLTDPSDTQQKFKHEFMDTKL